MVWSTFVPVYNELVAPSLSEKSTLFRVEIVKCDGPSSLLVKGDQTESYTIFFLRNSAKFGGWKFRQKLKNFDKNFFPNSPFTKYC